MLNIGYSTSLFFQYCGAAPLSAAPGLPTFVSSAPAPNLAPATATNLKINFKNKKTFIR